MPGACDTGGVPHLEMLVPPGKAALNSAQAADFVMIPVPEGEKWAKSSNQHDRKIGVKQASLREYRSLCVDVDA